MAGGDVCPAVEARTKFKGTHHEIFDLCFFRQKDSPGFLFYSKNFELKVDIVEIFERTGH
jgi:hypothetical protein